MTLTPLHLRILLHCHIHVDPFDHLGCSEEYEQQLIKLGLLEPSKFAYHCPNVTERGKAHIQQLLSLPLPQQAPESAYLTDFPRTPLNRLRLRLVTVTCLIPLSGRANANTNQRVIPADALE